MDLYVDMQIIEFDSFETAFPVQPGKESKVKRRFMTLFAQEGERAQVGGTSYVCKASSFTGEEFAVKRLLASAGIPQGANLTPEDTARITQGHAAAFYEEYKNQLLVSQMRGFPKLYGYGMIGNDPAIVMEWVEGVSLRDIARAYAERGEMVPAKTIAAMGASVLEVLDTAGRLSSTLVHRDISPANIMVRTNDVTLEEQVERGYFDICLIDFGSASANAPHDASFTMVSQVWRNGTPEYAPPEMLTQDIPHIDKLRKSQAIDVFALCGVLYELYAGHTPWRVGDNPELSPFRIKTERAPETVALRKPEDAPFIEALMSGLEIEQNQRPSVRRLYAELVAFAPLPGFEGESGEAGKGPNGTGVEGARTGIGSGAGTGRPLGPIGRDWMPAELYTPDSTHLKVATPAEGGRRAGEDVEPFVRQPKLLTRRNMIIGGLVLAGAAAAGALAARSCAPGASYDFSNYPTTSALYAGDSLYPAMRMNDSTWVLRDVRSGAELTIGCGNREPGRLVGGLMRAFDPASGNYGFMTAAEPGDVSGVSGSASGNAANGVMCAWRILPTFADVGDFSAVIGANGAAGTGTAAGAGAGAGTGTGAGAGVSEGAGSGSGSSSDADANAGAKAGADTGAGANAGTRAGADSATGETADLISGRLAAALDAKSGLWGYIDVAGNWVLQPEFAEARCFSRGYAAVRPRGSAFWALIDSRGNQVAGPQFAGLGMCSEEGLLAATDEAGLAWGFADASGSWPIPRDFAQVRRFSQGLAACRRKRDGLWEYINAAGETVIEARFADAFPFANGLAPAKDADTQLWGLIDSTGAWHIEPRYLSLGEQAGTLLPAHGSPANVYDIEGADKLAWMEFQRTNSDHAFGYGFIDEAGAWVVKPIYGDTLIRQPAL